MKKRVVSIILVLSMLVMFWPSNAGHLIAYAADGDFTIENGVLTKYNGSGGDVVIPDGVTEIGYEAFYNCTKVTSVTFSDSVKKIGDLAFYYCFGLTNITLSNSVTEIGDCAFFKCTKLTTVTIPKSITNIGKNAFARCKAITSINVDKNNMYYSSYEGILFNKDKTTLVYYPFIQETNYSIPSFVKCIGNGAFFGCSSLTSITIPNSVTSIDESAFEDCTDLTTVNMQNSVTSIGDKAFEGCSGLTSMTIPNSVKSIGKRAFLGCSHLTSITIPNSVTIIGECAFCECTRLTDVVLPNSITSVSRYTFERCSGLKSVTIPSSIKRIEEYAFFCCSSLTDLTIPNSVTDIDQYAFYGCKSIKNVVIPSSVENIGVAAFDSIDGLTSITVDAANKNYSSYDGVLYNKDRTLIKLCPRGKTGNVTVPNSVDVISEGAFYCCSNLTSITIPSSVNLIYYSDGKNTVSSFTGCNQLTSLIVDSANSTYSTLDGVLYNKDRTKVLFCPNGKAGNIALPKTVSEIFGFKNCTGLKCISIPSTLTTIYSGTFSGCDSLTDIYFSGNEQQWSNAQIADDGASINIGLPSSTTIHFNYKFSITQQPTSKTINLGDSVTLLLKAEGESLTYQWYYKKSGSSSFTAWSGKTNASETFTPDFSWNGAQFYCVVKDVVGSTLTSNTVSLTVKNTSKPISDTTVTLSQTSYIYDGTAKKPTVTVKDGTKTLTSGTDYTFSYSNNTNVGTATVKITGTGNYTGTTSKTFTISAKPISGTTVTLNPTSFIYDGAAKKPTVTVKDGTKTLTTGTDFTVSYSNNINVGTATVTVTGKGNYTGTISKNFTIIEVPKTDISNCTVTISQTSYIYDGTAKKPTVTVKDGTKTLTSGTDYTVSYSNNINVGTATVTVTGAGNYTGTTLKTFTISAKSISGTTVTLNPTSFTYDGTAKKPTVTVKDGTKTLTNGTDYTVSYSNNTNVGTAKATVTGKGNYTGSKSVTFEIKPKQNKFTNGADNWSFDNTRRNFGNTYYMSEKYWNALLNGLSNTEKNRMIENVKNEQWGGSCYGMAVTSILASHGILQPSKYQSGANFLHDISAPPTNEVKSLINYYFALQYTNVIYNKTSNSFYVDEKTKLNSLLSSVNDGLPALLCFFGDFYGEYPSGHAVVAYGVEYGTFAFNGKAYNGKIIIYDNNNIDYSDDYCLYFNSSKGSWMIPEYQLDSETGSTLGFITSDLAYINYHGYLNGTTNVTVDDYIAVLHSSPINGNFSLKKAKYSNGVFTTTATSDDDIKVFSSLADNNFENSDLMFAMKDASSGYVLKTSSNENLDLTLSYENSLLSAKANNATTAKFSPDSYVELGGSNMDYHLGIVLNDGYTVCDWYGFTVDGKNADKAILQASNNGYILSASNLNNVSVTGYNDSVTAKRTFSTSYKKVFLYEIDKNTIGAAVDTDNNGTFETPLNLTITTQPTNKTVNLGESVTLSLKAQGSGLTYQWYYKKAGQTSFSTWNGRTHASETCTPNATWDGIQLYCIVKDSANNSVKSNTITVTVKSGPVITKPPTNQTISLGSSVTLSLTATGTGLTYQWYYKKTGQTSFSTWNGRTHASETVTPNATWDGIQLYCIVKDSGGNSVKSNTVTVTVKSGPVITKQPTNQTISLGDSVTLSLTATGTGLTYQWYYKKSGQTSFSTWNGRTHASETCTPNATWNGIQLYCIVKDSAGNKVQSNTVTVKVNSAGITITQQPQNQSIIAGKELTLSVKATGNSLKFQWYYKKKGQTSFNIWNGRTHATETVSPNSTWDGIQLYCKITDGSGKTLNSSTVTINVLSITTQPSNVTVAAGSNATFKVVATGSGLKYQWQYKKSGQTSWSNWGARTTASTTATSNATWQGMQVRCIVTDSAGNKVTSNAATITIK